MTGPEYDAELEAFLKRRSSIHRRLSASDHAEPSVEIDRLVLSRAREAIETPEQPLYRTSRWALPIGLAAAILIAFTVVLNIDHHGKKPVASNAPPATEAAARGPAPLMTSTRSLVVQSAHAPQQAGAKSPPTTAAPAPSPAPAAVAAADPHSSPDAWLREIKRLRAAGRTADADRELAAFRTAYPSHPAYSVAKPPAR
jgi:hypothetical protein